MTKCPFSLYDYDVINDLCPKFYALRSEAMLQIPWGSSISFQLSIKYSKTRF